MKITQTDSNNQIAAELGVRIKDLRIARGYTQQEFAERVGLSLRTICNIEAGRDSTLSSLMSVMRGLGILQNADILIPEQGPRPSDIAKLGKKRQRASSPRKLKKSREEPSSWQWGEDR